MARTALAVALLFSVGAARAAAPVELPRGLAFAVEPPPVLAEAVLTPSALGLSGVTWGRNLAANAHGVPLEALGRGDFGAAYVHPADPELMLKVAADGFGKPVPRRGIDMDADVLEEAVATRRLAEAGAGPRLIGVTRLPHRLQPLVDRMAAWFGVRTPDWSRAALVKERVRGETVGALARAKRFAPEHAAMVRDLRTRIEAAGLKATDLHGENIMIGTTASRPAPRAYLIDAGFVGSR